MINRFFALLVLSSCAVMPAHGESVLYINHAPDVRYSADELDGIIEEIPLGRSGSPFDVAETILFLASEKSSFITGQTIGVNGGMIV